MRPTSQTPSRARTITGAQRANSTAATPGRRTFRRRRPSVVARFGTPATTRGASPRFPKCRLMGLFSSCAALVRCEYRLVSAPGQTRTRPDRYHAGKKVGQAFEPAYYVNNVSLVEWQET